VSALLHIPIEPGIITVEEFEAMDLPEFCEWELIDGTVVSVTSPELDHVDLQHQIAANLERLFGVSAVVRLEYPYALGTFNRFRADVAIVNPKRHRSNRKRLEGPPELVVEVMSRSNSEKKTRMLQQRCLEQGCLAFWRVYPKKRTIIVATIGGETTYESTGIIPAELFGISAEIVVNEIFDALT